MLWVLGDVVKVCQVINGHSMLFHVIPCHCNLFQDPIQFTEVNPTLPGHQQPQLITHFLMEWVGKIFLWSLMVTQVTPLPGGQLANHISLAPIYHRAWSGETNNTHVMFKYDSLTIKHTASIKLESVTRIKKSPVRPSHLFLSCCHCDRKTTVRVCYYLPQIDPKPILSQPKTDRRQTPNQPWIKVWTNIQ